MPSMRERENSEDREGVDGIDLPAFFGPAITGEQRQSAWLSRSRDGQLPALDPRHRLGGSPSRRANSRRDTHESWRAKKLIPAERSKRNAAIPNPVACDVHNYIARH